MSLSWGCSIIGLAIVLVILILVWMTKTRRRDRHDAREVVELEVAVCIRKENGDVIIRQRRGKSLLGLTLGILILLGGGAMIVALISRTSELGLQGYCVGSGLLILGVLTAWASGRGFRDPHVTISVAARTVNIRHGFPGSTQTKLFSEISGVVGRSQSREDALLGAAEILIDPRYAGKSTHRTIISLKCVDGEEVRLCTATEKAAERIPAMIAAALDKPLLTT